MDKGTINGSVRKLLIKNMENRNTKACPFSSVQTKIFFGTWGNFYNSGFPYYFTFAKGPKLENLIVHSNFSKHLQCYKDLFFPLTLLKFKNFLKFEF